MKWDWVVVGAGFTGAVIAERFASQLDQRVLLVDRRDHIAGNAYDYHDEHGVLVHKFGPHVFHTNSLKIWDYISQFTQWRPYYHHARAVVDGKPVPIPFNLNSIEALFPASMAARMEQKLVARYGFNVKVPILKMREQEDADLKLLADYIYKNVFEGYTIKQWDLRPEELDASVTGRVPVYVSRDDRYFQDSYQALPCDGYTEMFRRILSHKNIHILLKTDYKDIADDFRYTRTLYTGPIDEYFEYIHGHLPYRSLRFEFRNETRVPFQAVGSINYPNEHSFTRSTEFRHLTGQQATTTTVVYEYPEPYVDGVNEPYYPIPRPVNKVQHAKYEQEIERLESRVTFAGRLADYKYYNMDQAIGRALKVFEYISAGSEVAAGTTAVGL